MRVQNYENIPVEPIWSLRKHWVRLAVPERSSTDNEISGIFSGPRAFSEPWFSSPEVDFRTLGGNLRWCVTSLINTHPMEQRSTRLRAEIGFSGKFIF